MKILFKNTTKYNKENRDNFMNFHLNKYGKKELIRAILILIAITYIVIFNIINFNWKLLLILVLIGILLYFINKQLQMKIKEKNKKQKNKEYTFFFYERYIKIRFRRQFERMNYFELKKIYETDENFFLYVDEKNSLILDKDGFSIGTAKEFSDFIKRKCPFKYSNQENK